jgi:hypothetical protein
MKGSGAFRWMTIVLATSVVVLATAAVAPASPPRAGTASGCGVGRGQGFGYTYLTSLSVKGIGCASGRSVVKHRGGRGWRCAKQRLAGAVRRARDVQEWVTSGSVDVHSGHVAN